MADETYKELLWAGVTRVEPDAGDLLWRDLVRAAPASGDLLWNIPPKRDARAEPADADLLWQIPRKALVDVDDVKGLPKPSAIAAEQEPGLIRALLAVWRAHAAGIDMTALEAAVSPTGTLEAVLEALDVETLGEQQTAALLPRLIKCVRLGFEVGAEPLRKVGVVVRAVDELTTVKQSGVSIDLTMMNPFAAQWASEHAAELVATDAATKARIRALILRSQTEGIAPDKLARLLLEVIGLNDPQTEAVANFQQRLILAGVPEATVDARTARYADAKLRERSFDIARTESVSSLGAGQQILWDKAVESGAIHAKDFVKTWIVAGDEGKTCDVCLENEAAEDVPIDGEFPSGDLRPAAHNRCRCACGLMPAKN